MIKQGHIGYRETALLIWFAIAGKIILSLPAILLADALSAGWMVALGAGLLSLVAFLPGVFLLRRLQGLPYARAGDEAAGLAIGKVAGVVTTAFLSLIASGNLRGTSEALVTTLLPTTPLAVLVITLALVVGFSAYVGLEALARLTIFLFPWLAGLLGLILLGEYSLMDFRRLSPLWGRGPAALAADLFPRTALYGEVVLLLILYPYLRRRSEAIRAGVWAILLSTVFLTAVQVTVTAIFDVSNTEQVTFPLIALTRLLSFGRFISRVEALAIPFWIFVVVMQTATLLWGTATNLAETLRLPTHRPLFAPLVAVASGMALLPRGLSEAKTLHFEYVYRWGGLIAFALPAALWFLAVLRGKRRLAGPAPDEEAGKPPWDVKRSEQDGCESQPAGRGTG